MRIQSLDCPGATGLANTGHFELQCIARHERRDLEEDGPDEGSVAEPLNHNSKLSFAMVFESDIALLAARFALALERASEELLVFGHL